LTGYRLSVQAGDSEFVSIFLTRRTRLASDQTNADIIYTTFSDYFQLRENGGSKKIFKPDQFLVRRETSDNFLA
jgi:hypothetical protein